MRRIVLLMAVVAAALQSARAEVDPNFYIYICFGQSNMEGNAQWEAQDVGNVDPRFQMLATCNFTNPKRTLGNWYTAECPIVSPDGKLGPTDYFGRTMVKELPFRERQIVILYFWNRMTLSEIAETLGVSHASVFRGLEKAKKKLKLELEGG